MEKVEGVLIRSLDPLIRFLEAKVERQRSAWVKTEAELVAARKAQAQLAASVASK